MPLPVGVDAVTLNAGTNGLRGPDGTARTGTVTLTPSVDRVVSSEHGMIVLGPSNATLGASGQFTLGPILATDADGFTPSGWTYRVDENFTGQPPRSYSVSLPASVPVVALPDLVEVSASDGTVVLQPPGGGTPSATVVAETGYGQSATAGVATAYSRGDHSHGTPALPPTGTTAGTYAAGNDSRLSDARTPTAHAASHGSGGSDPVTPAAIGADPTGTASAAVSSHAGASDPHGDRAYANSTFATQSTVSTIDGYLNDALTRLQAIEQGTAYLAGGHFTGPVDMTSSLTVGGYTTLQGGQFNGDFAAFGDMTLYGTNKGFRFRRGGSATDFEGAGTDLLVSVWSGGDFSGTQHSYLRLSADAQNAQLAGPLEVVSALYGGAVHKLDPTTGVAALGAKNTLANIRAAGRLSTAGAPTSGTWTAGDTVQDAAGAWWLCTAGGTPGTWSGGAQAWVFDVTAYGAKGDGKVVADGAMASGSATLTSATAGFTAADVGKAISVKGAAGTGVTTLVTTISAYVSATQVTLAASNASGGTVSGAIVIWGTDDTSAIQAAVDAAEAYLAGGRAYAQVYFPPRAPYIVAGALNTSKSGNGQIVFGVCSTTATKKILEFRGATDGAAAVRHWQQTVPQYAGSCIISLGVFASTAAQISSINAAGNPGVISGPNEGAGYGAGAVYSNVQAVIRNLAILTTHSAYGLTYGAANLYGCANCHIENFGYGTAGVVPGNDYSSPGTFGTGLSIGLLLPAPGNNDHVVANNISCGGGYTYAAFVTEHLMMTRYMALYCWAGLVAVGNYFGSVGSVHAMKVIGASIEACINELYILGVGSAGIGPIIDIDQLSTESSTPNIGGQTTHMAAARGIVRWTGLFTESGLTHDNPCGIESVNAQAVSAVRAVTGSTTARPIDRAIKADATAGGVTVSLPSAAPNPVVYTIIKSDASGNTVTVDPAGSETINGSATRVLSSQWDTVTLRSDGTNWLAI